MSILSITKTLFKSMVHGPYTVKYPVVQKAKFERTRGSIDNDIEACIFCGMCERRCPCGAIKVERAEKKWSIERMQCVQCGYCVEVCPKKCLDMNNQYTAPAGKKIRDELVDARVSDNEKNN